jgi:polyisoprenyl-phosphate glycosyltransferase
MILSVVIPVYNGGTTIGELNRRLKKELNGSFSYKIIMVCDPCRDNTHEVVKGIVTSDPLHTEVWFNIKRMGQHKAILYGIEKSSGDFIVTLDDDLQHDPAYIKELVRTQNEKDFDVVYAVFRKLSHNRIRSLVSYLFRKVLTICVPGICPWYSPYRLIRKETAKKMLAFDKPYVFIDGYLGKVTDSFGAIDAIHMDRGGGRSAYTVFRLVRHACLILWYYSDFRKISIKPLRNSVKTGLHSNTTRISEIMGNK